MDHWITGVFFTVTVDTNYVEKKVLGNERVIQTFLNKRVYLFTNKDNAEKESKS